MSSNLFLTGSITDLVKLLLQPVQSIAVIFNVTANLQSIIIIIIISSSSSIQHVAN